MVTTPRVPPRFVPTLTEVVPSGEQPVPHSAPAQRPLAAPERRLPPVVSTPSVPIGLAVAVRSSAQPVAVPKPVQTAPVAAPQASALPAAATEKTGFAATALAPPTPVQKASARELLSEDFEELLVHRVMQRVDVSLDLRLRDAIASVVLEQTRSILPRLREEVESVVRHAVYEAVADELASKSNQ